MSLNARDPQFGVKLTAYALGELDGKELKEVEEAVASNPSLQREVAAIREMVGTLTRELEREPAQGLTREQRARVTEGAPQSKVSLWVRNFLAGMTLTRVVPALAIGAIAFGYFGPFGAVLNRSDVNAPMHKKLSTIEAITPEGQAQQAVPAVADKASLDTAPALKSEQAKESERIAVGTAGERSAPKNQPKADSKAGGLAKLSGADKSSERDDGASAPAEPAPAQGAPTALAETATMTNADPMAVAPSRPAPVATPKVAKPASPPAKSISAPSQFGQAPQGALGGAALSRSRAFNRGQVATTVGGKGKAQESKKRPAVVAPGDSRDEVDTLSKKDDSYFDTETYDRVVDNEFKKVSQEPLSTFSIDVDTGSYSNLRRFLNGGSLPPKDSVRVEEFLNYFPYTYEAPKKSSSDPFAVNVEVNEAPWNREHRLVRIGLKGKELEAGKRPPSNLVFLLDVSGSMDEPNKLPWVKESLKMLTQQLGENDKVSIVVYAGNSGLLLPPTRGNHKQTIIDALENLQSGGSTNGGQGIELAYKVARDNFIPKGTNRVILATDGDFNVGVTNQGDLIRLIETKAKEGVFLSVLGFGMGNLKDSTMVKLADKGHGHYAYIDTLAESKKVLVDEIGSTLVTIAKDVKIQVEFNPAEVAAFRLVGYEKRIMAHEDFNDDTKDAGIIGAGHTVTALYEVVPFGASIDAPSVDPLKYQKPKEKSDAAKSGELMTLKLRYKAPEDGSSKLMSFPIKDEGKRPAQASKDFKFQSAIAAFGMLLRESQHKGTTTYDNVIDLAQSGKGDDKQGYRAEFIELVRKAKGLKAH